MFSHDDVIKLTMQISNFLIEKEIREKKVLSSMMANGLGPYDDFAYAEAIMLAKKNGHRSYFSTEDIYLLTYASELREKFLLEVVTREEGLRREQSSPTITTIVTGIPEVTKEMN